MALHDLALALRLRPRHPVVHGELAAHAAVEDQGLQSAGGFVGHRVLIAGGVADVDEAVVRQGDRAALVVAEERSRQTEAFDVVVREGVGAEVGRAME